MSLYHQPSLLAVDGQLEQAAAHLAAGAGAGQTEPDTLLLQQTLAGQRTAGLTAALLSRGQGAARPAVSRWRPSVNGPWIVSLWRSVQYERLFRIPTASTRPAGCSRWLGLTGERRTWRRSTAQHPAARGRRPLAAAVRARGQQEGQAAAAARGRRLRCSFLLRPSAAPACSCSTRAIPPALPLPTTIRLNCSAAQCRPCSRAWMQQVRRCDWAAVSACLSTSPRCRRTRAAASQAGCWCSTACGAGMRTAAAASQLLDVACQPDAGAGH